MKIKRTTESGAKITYEKIPIKEIGEPSKKKKEKKKKKMLAKPKKEIVKKLSATKTILKNRGEVKMVTKGEEGFFKDEYDKERSKFLGRYSL